ncbi:transcriptional regulator with XRE-family HTH domain [Saccharothrix coeruleofusca]|uniref:helix-turn-helix transcriptional regulator n=1 Tax=Saccharothrix coeruleofusca TaxID=33919 RepID=UPI001AEA910D|nr:helix-turn-helix transcriptional regulator [Saccharothrix coeruleofusca]MBP2335494.1 transcriptional regulator with XRE-family HTH domain [Saccharothrix coeruleofusca]
MSEVGDFLRARRAQTDPADVGLPVAGHRRVAGLRREEVAVLAGVNADYYARLEQGRERHPSPQVLDALCTALRLDAEARDHLHRLAGVVPAHPPTPDSDVVDPALRRLLDGYPTTPAFVLNRTLDLLASNTLADTLFSPFTRKDNLARMVFADPVGREFYAHWEQAAERVVGHLREGSGHDPGSPRLRALVAELRQVSPKFAELWDSHVVRAKTSEGDKQLVHPEVGPLALTYQTFEVRSAPGQQLVVYHAEPGSADARALALLGSPHAAHDTAIGQARVVSGG